MKKFEQSDIFVSTLKVYPKVKFFGYSGSIYYNNTNETSVKLNDFLPTAVMSSLPEGSILDETGDSLLTEDEEYIVIE